MEEMRRLPRGLLPGSISGHVDASEFGALLAQVGCMCPGSLYRCTYLLVLRQVPVRANVAADELLSAGLRGNIRTRVLPMSLSADQAPS